jgi:hypothetical protein
VIDDEEGRQQDIDNNGMGPVTSSASAFSSAMTASGQTGGTSGSISLWKLHSNIFMSCSFHYYLPFVAKLAVRLLPSF